MSDFILHISFDFRVFFFFKEKSQESHWNPTLQHDEKTMK